jgi:hypothetical protein
MKDMLVRLMFAALIIVLTVGTVTGLCVFMGEPDPVQMPVWGTVYGKQA